MKHTDEIYDNLRQLIAAHQADTPEGYAKEAYDRTECGVWTAFILEDGTVIPSTKPLAYCDHVVGIRHGTIVEGSDAEFTASDLMFPFSDEQLADAWQYLEDEAETAWTLAND